MLRSFFKKTFKPAIKIKQEKVYLPHGELSYELQFKSRKTLGIYIQGGKVVVRAPYGADTAKIESFLYDKSDWVLRKLKEHTQKQVQQKCIFWEDGGSLSYLGQELTLKFNEQTSRVVLNQDSVLEVGAAQLAGKNKQCDVDRRVQQWMQQQALILFQLKCTHFGAIIGVYPEKIALTSAKTRWGSANARRVIRLHWRLLQMPHEVIDYVVVHELAHLKEMNHSHRFWAVVESVLPDYAQRRAQLKRTSLPVW